MTNSVLFEFLTDYQGFNTCELKSRSGVVFSEWRMSVFLHKILEMIKTGIYGQLDTDKEILERILDVPELNLVGVCCPNGLISGNINHSGREIKAYRETDSMLNDVEAVIALSPLSGFENIELFVRNSKHVFFEPSSEYYKNDVSKLSGIIEEANVKVQAGFHHRFNNTFLAARPFIKNPKFIQSNNFRKFNFNTESCSVLMDMLIGDIDIVLSVIRSGVKNIHANATSINFVDPDIINVRLEFMNGSVAQLTAGRIATENSHELSFYCEKDYTNIDLCRNRAWLVKKRNEGSEIRLFQENIGDLIVDPIPVKANNTYYDEFSSFARSIVYNKAPEVDMETVIKTYDIISKIRDKIRLSSSI